ncbi:Na+/H+ antiporter [Methylovirgula ligni]|uniref:Sodium/proton antiporter (CPA1 family) n=1 Tax=Methylovirgula ligni TaxID=569860 RepID=A0A3D9YYC8_9HYPH|nr:Na+/H+ antiporter [Methylovirgula ligni]QAY94391.1 Na+/H+ antiporter [Methylovirgula ligni]REF87763.1 sodium/proton antiporter (CPA1 family) [Methylovirgula ligni]
MPHAALIAFALIALTMTGAILARRLHLPASIFLVVFGIAASFVPGLPHIPIEPNVVLQVLLPPLLYIAGVGMSWRGFKREFAEISLLAVGCVCATAAAVAFTVHGLLGWPLALGFVLGAIVAPPDAVAPLALTDGLALPQRIVTILEGEGLVNDATALIIFSFAVTAVETASFSLPQATGLFVIVAIAGVAWGLAVGWGTLRLRRAIGDPQIELTIALLAPYIAFWPLQALGGSGVLAAVTAGLYVSANGAGSIPPATRLQGYFFWRLVVYITEGSIFVITGLQARPILETLQKDSWEKLPLAIGVVILAVVAVRLIWVVVLTRVPRDLIRKSKHKAPPPWQHDFFIGFTGIRGVVSLAAALSIPFMVDGAPFPERDIVLIITFAVILATLVGQGLSLPWLVRKLGLDAEGRRESAAAKDREIRARVLGVEAVLTRLGALDGISAGTMRVLKNRHRDRRDTLISALKRADGQYGDSLQVQLSLIEAERQKIAELYAQDALSDEARRRIERELDLEDARVRHAYSSALPIKYDDPLT